MSLHARRRLGLVVVSACLACAGHDASLATLVGLAVLPAGTQAEGPASGHALGTSETHGYTAPFSQQPVQGVSAVVPVDGELLALVDNGFGVVENSADFRLRVYRLGVEPQRAGGGAGSISVGDFIELRDPDGHCPFVITNELSEDRLLTGADFDPESMQRGNDGTLWIGDELGPYLLHFDADGKLLEAPIELPAFDGRPPLRSPQSPAYEENSALRIMNAAWAHARRHGATRRPAVSPNHQLLADGDPATGVWHRSSPPEGLNAASSELFAPRSLQSAGFPVIPWTVNDPTRMRELLALGVAGIITDSPDRLYEELQQFDADGDGKPGDLLDADGLVDRARFDLQGHRGARDLRPENTLPAMEVALDHFVTTLELDVGITSDGVAVISHDPVINPSHCRRVGEDPDESPVMIHDRTIADIQGGWVCDETTRRRPGQTNVRMLSPVSVAFAQEKGLADPYVMPTLAQVYEFVEFYAEYYRSGPGKDGEDAKRRVVTAQRVHFNVETKTNPVVPESTAPPAQFARVTGRTIEQAGAVERSNIQSFDFRTLMVVQEELPAIQTAYLFGDSPASIGYGGANLENDNWRAGLGWSYRYTRANAPARIGQSAGFEGLAMAPDGKRLYAMLEKPLVGSRNHEVLVFVYDIERGEWLGVRHRYPLDERATSIGAFQVTPWGTGVVIERDDGEGKLDAFKRIYEFSLIDTNVDAGKRPIADLMDLANPHRLGSPTDGDVGAGDPFGFPFFTIESLMVIDETRLVVLNDNNFPLHVGRHVGSDAPDDTEWIEIELREPLAAPRRRLAR